MKLNLFHHVISFKTIDPLGNGLGEEIETERLEPEAITLEEGLNEGEIEAYWQSVQDDLQKEDLDSER